MMHVLLKAENDDVRSFYENHKTFYKGDCGLDLFCTEDVTVAPGETLILHLGLHVSAFKRLENGSLGRSVGWLLFPRSSMSKTPLRLSNSVGVIDPQYRGEVVVSVDNIKDFPYTVRRGDRLVQMVSYDGEEISFQVGRRHAQLVDSVDDTDRGANGFGSTGR